MPRAQQSSATESRNTSDLIGLCAEVLPVAAGDLTCWPSAPRWLSEFLRGQSGLLTTGTGHRVKIVVHFHAESRTQVRQAIEDALGEFLRTGQRQTRLAWNQSATRFIQIYLWTDSSDITAFDRDAQGDVTLAGATSGILFQPVQLSVLVSFAYQNQSISDYLDQRAALPNRPRRAKPIRVNKRARSKEGVVTGQRAMSVDSALAAVVDARQELISRLSPDLSRAVITITDELLHLQSTVLSSDIEVWRLSVDDFFKYYDRVYATGDAPRSRLIQQFEGWLRIQRGSSYGSGDKNYAFASGIQQRAKHLNLKFACPGPPGSPCGLPANFRWKESRGVAHGMFYFGHLPEPDADDDSPQQKYECKHGLSQVVPDLTLIPPLPDRRLTRVARSLRKQR